MPPPAGPNKVTLLGLDFGSTTTSMLVIEAGIASQCATGRMGFHEPRAVFRPEPVFTPFKASALDLVAIRRQLLLWLAEAKLAPEDVFAGGAIVTGLAAERDNAEALAALVVELLGEAVVATADDPRLESWLAFMGATAGLSRTYPDVSFLNLDIGGGTTNPALGKAGQVTAAGCHFIGARHFEFEPGSYRLSAVSRVGAGLLGHLGLGRAVGDTLRRDEIEQIVGYFVAALVALAEGDRGFFANAIGGLIEQVPFAIDGSGVQPAAITFSGGVGEIVYALAAGVPSPPITHYGDLGVDLAQAILANERLARDIGRYLPEHGGRATVQGLTLSNTEVSGTTLFLCGTNVLPLRDLPVIGVLPASANAAALAEVLALAGQSGRGAALHLVWDDPHPPFDAVKRLAADMASALASVELPGEAPLVVLTTANVGKALGNYVTRWRTLPRKLMIIDEIPVRNAQFVNLGRLRNGVVPVSFFGMD